MVRIKTPFNHRLTEGFTAANDSYFAANDNKPKIGAIFPLEDQQITEELAWAVAHMLKTLAIPRRPAADHIMRAICDGPFEVRYPDGDFLLYGYEPENDLGSDYTFSWIRDLIDAASGKKPLPPLTDLTKRRLNLIVLWLYIEGIDRGDKIPIPPALPEAQTRKAVG